MMAVVPFRWQGATRIEQLRSLLSTRAREWVSQWSVPGLEADSDITELAEPAADRTADRWYEVVAKAGALRICVPTHAFEQLGCRLVGAMTSDTNDMAEGIGRRALTDLARSLTNGSGEEGTLVEGKRPGMTSLDSRCGVAGFLWTFAGLRVSLFLDAALCDALVPRGLPASPPLTARAEAILSGEVTLTAVLDLGHASLEDTVTLRPGEIIKTNTKLDANVSLQSESGEIVASGMLVAADGYRALRCERTSRR